MADLEVDEARGTLRVALQVRPCVHLRFFNFKKKH